MLLINLDKAIRSDSDPEREFKIQSYDPSEYEPGDDLPETLTIHPWHRYKGTKHEDRSVAIQIILGYPDDPASREIIIVDRSEFVTGLLNVFPELERAKK